MHVVDNVGIFTPKRVVKNEISAGEVGFVEASIKEIRGAPVGIPSPMRLHRMSLHCQDSKVQAQVYAGLFPVSSDDFDSFRDALEKLTLNDAALSYEPENSDALGVGFRCGFLGMLHMEIVQERLEREYDLDLITSAPTVVYEVLTSRGDVIKVESPSRLPPANNIEEMREPVVEGQYTCTAEHVGNVLSLCVEKRGVQKDMQFVGQQVSIKYELQ